MFGAVRTKCHSDESEVFAIAHVDLCIRTSFMILVKCSLFELFELFYVPCDIF